MSVSIYTHDDRNIPKYKVADAIHYAREFLLAQNKAVRAVIPPGLFNKRNEQITLEELNEIQLDIIVSSVEYLLGDSIDS